MLRHTFVVSLLFWREARDLRRQRTRASAVFSRVRGTSGKPRPVPDRVFLLHCRLSSLTWLTYLTHGNGLSLGFFLEAGETTCVTTMLDAGVDLRDVQLAARHADPRTTMRYDRARKNLDRDPNYRPA